MKENFLDGMKLPKSSPQEELEQLSKDKLRPLFPHELFEIREETYRDKGIDLIIELKYKSNYTNFRFLVQLKSTESKSSNSDKSYSWQIETSNIQYLLNGGLPAYYICYIKGSDVFLFRQLNEFVTEISTTKQNWANQKSHILRTGSILNKNTIKGIYEEVKNRNRLLRELNEQLFIANIGNDSKKVSISDNLEVIDETSIVKFIENNGFFLLEEGRSKELILLNEKVSSNITITSPIYNLILGIANFYCSNLFDALSFLKKSKQKKEKLEAWHLSNLDYINSVVKFSIGSISKEEHLENLKLLKDSKLIKHYAKIDLFKNESDFQNFKKGLFQIIQDDNVPIKIKIISKCEYLLRWGSEINNDLFNSFAKLKAIELLEVTSMQFKKEIAQSFLSQREEWVNFYKEINKDIAHSNDSNGFNMCLLFYTKVTFELLVYNFYINKYSNDSKSNTLIGKNQIIKQTILNLKEVSSNYENQGSIENLIMALASQYEVYQFVEEKNESNKILKKIKELIDFYELKEQKEKIDYLANGGTINEVLHKIFQDTIEKQETEYTEYLGIIEKMKILDQREKRITKKTYLDEIVVVELFPIGHFFFERTKFKVFCEILEITSIELIKHLNIVFFDKKIIPVLNIYNRIKNEGYTNGHGDDRGFESWKRIGFIRTKLFENKIWRYSI